MAISDQVQAPEGASDTAWYALPAGEVATRLGVDPATGLSAARAAELLAKNGPNALPVEQPPSTLRRLLAEYTSYMQIILVAAAIVSLVIQQWATAIVLFVITLFNALVGLRQAGKAESAMNALQSMMKATARVRRDGTEAEIPAEQVVVGDVHCVETVGAGHGKSEHSNAVRISTEVDAADQQVLVDYLEDVVKDVPGRLGVSQQNVLTGIEGTRGLVEVKILQRVGDVDAPVGIARHTDDSGAGAGEFLLETGEERARKLVENVSLREKPFPISVVVDQAPAQVNRPLSAVHHYFA